MRMLANSEEKRLQKRRPKLCSDRSPGAERERALFAASKAVLDVRKREKIALWTGVEGNGSIVYHGDGTIGHGLAMDIAKGLSIHEVTCYSCIAHLDTKASSEHKDGKSSLTDRCL